MNDITLETFINTIFQDTNDNETPLLSKQIDLGGAFANGDLINAKRWLRGKAGAAVYFNVSTVRVPAEGEKLRRRKQDCVAAYAVVLDDIGSKVEAEHPEPSWIMETSADNFQYGYILEPTEDLDQYESLITALGERGLTDPGAEGCNRLMRVPGSVNLKEGRNNFVSTVTLWEPDRWWTLDALATAFGLDLDALPVKAVHQSVTTTLAGAEALDGIDPMLDWLSDSRYVVDDDGSEWVKVKCPWHESHTTGEDTAGYSPLGRGEGPWVQRRAFKCLHAHCADKKLGKFVKWAIERGGPSVSGVDPLPWLQARYVYVGVGQRVADLHKRPSGGDWLLALDDWGNLYKGRIYIEGRDNPIEIKTAFLEHEATTKAMNVMYDPRGGSEALVQHEGQTNINLYVPPQHPETSDEPAVFLDHMDYLFGDYADLFLDWLAWKFQNPGKRSYAVVCVAHEAFGTGRSWLRKALTAALQGHVNGATLAQLIGKGTSAEKNYNDWATRCQFLVIEEAKDNLSRDDFYHGYETFKQMVDNNVTKQRINPKFGKTRDEYIFFNALIFTNHTDAMVLPEGDRRVLVLPNPTERETVEYYDRLNNCLERGEDARIYRYLMARDVGSFDHVYPLMTPAKTAMLEHSLSPYDEIRAHVIEGFEGDIVTRQLTIARVKSAARDLDFERIEASPGPVGRRIWLSFGNLRGEKNGARYKIDTIQTEMRAVRNIGKWAEVDAKRQRDDLVEEMKKCTSAAILAFPPAK